MAAMGFPARLAAFLAVVVLASTLAATALWTQGQHRRLHAAVASHAGFVLGEIKTALETRLNLGLALAELPQVQPLLDGARGAMPAVLSVAVLDEEGAVVFSSSPVEVGERLAGLPAAEPGAVWAAERGGEWLYGIGLTTSFDTTAGQIVLRVPGDVAAEPTRTFALKLGIGGLLLAVPVILLAGIAGLGLLRGPRRSVEAVAGILETLTRDADPYASGDVPDAPLPAFAGAVRARLTLLAEAERDVSRLDEMA
ncbi:hypothetical protein [Azospirillum sp. TSO22-1]|uniref:hypothetical protein n=1 Tax=Azospirillum sp. TSO22-1 TaxID=716789 RepID=UPI000D604A50|nr:hypothetical protein [Azospirillum sp. TSO22-1]PWC52493.1 hypothetical protein TSO221_14045 [Azospirillum sp. TSO22-1]